jgi:Membrane domain of glycerophosphoryl diester phosphodiesterase
MSDSSGGFTPPPPPPPSAGGGGPIPLRGVGEILSTAFNVYKANAAKLITIVAIVVVPLALIDALLTKVVWAPKKETVQTFLGPQTVTLTRGLLVVLLASVIGAVLAFVMSFVVQAAVSRAAAQATIGDPVDTETSYRWGFQHLGSVILIALLSGLFILVGLVLFIIPGIIVLVMLCVVIPVLVFEGKRGTEALRRSWELVKGSFWHALGTILLAAIIAAFITGILTSIGSSNWLIYFICSAIGRVITVPFTALVSVLLYLDLRARKESLTGDTLRSEVASGA